MSARLAHFSWGVALSRRVKRVLCTSSRKAGRADGGLRGGSNALPDSPIRVWIVGATGFRQNYARVTGLELLWRQMRGLSAPDVSVTTPQRWDEDPAAMAAYMARNSQPGATVFFYGYSYGVGNFFPKFARALQAYGMGVETAVLCDGVRRFMLGKFLSFALFRGEFTIAVPESVGLVYAFQQREDRWLQGHDVVAEAPGRTEVAMIELHGYDHYSIDEAGSFHRVALKEAADVIARSKGVAV